ncbi:unnamed protein product, partial [Sphenostylis stenocarpa]
GEDVGDDKRDLKMVHTSVFTEEEKITRVWKKGEISCEVKESGEMVHVSGHNKV